MCGKSVHKNSDCGDANGNHTCSDSISGLPDDILVGILSTLPLKEAARTSILSPRWENLWKQTSNLNFDDDPALCRIVKNREKLTKERRKYMKWVNKVIESYKGFDLKEFRICFDLDKSSAQNTIDRWLQFAFERRVERLELDFNLDGDMGRGTDVCTLPMMLFKPHQPRSLFDSLKYLRALCLRSVDVSDQDIDVFLRGCPLLDHLLIDGCKISNLDISGAFALKHLEILFCGGLKLLKVSAPNLISLKVTHARTLLLESVPKLVDVNVSSCNKQVNLVLSLFCCLSQLEILTLDLDFKEELLEKYSECEFPELPKLKKLEIVFMGRGNESMIALTSLTRAAPILQELLIRMRWSRLLRTNRKERNVLNSPHQHLKMVKFLGYYGRSSDEELVRYLLDNCVVLETLIIDPRYQPELPHFPLHPSEIDGLVEEGEQTLKIYPEKFDGLDAVKTSRKYAKKQLQGKIPQHIELVIL